MNVTIDFPVKPRSRLFLPHWCVLRLCFSSSLSFNGLKFSLNRLLLIQVRGFPGMGGSADGSI